jgi:hypothetical protein
MNDPKLLALGDWLTIGALCVGILLLAAGVVTGCVTYFI